MSKIRPMGVSFFNLAVVICVPWNLSNVVDAKIVCKPVSSLNPDCQTTCDRDPTSPFCKNLCECSGTVNETCALLDSSPREVEENATEGTPLFQIPVSSGETWEYRLGRTESVDGSPLLKLQDYLKLLKFANKYEMVLNQPLDIEAIYKDYGIILTTLLLKLTCTLGTTGNSETTEIFLVIKPINEYAPEFTGPLKFDIAENTKVGDTLIILRLLAQDRDVNPSGTEIAFYKLWKYLPSPTLDGSSYFVMADTQKGSIELQKDLDYETLRPLDATTLYLNVSATDAHGLSTFAVLIVHVDDVDDLPPEFYHPGCPVFSVRSKPCVVAYEAEIFVNYQGPLTKIFPYRVHARDMDFLKATITYALEEAPGQNADVMNKFTINSVSGQIDVISSFQKPQIVRLVIVAMQPSGNPQIRFARASLQVSIVSEPGPLDVHMLRPSPTLTSRDLSNDDKEKGLPLYLIITLAAGLLFLIIHSIICVVCIKHTGDKRQRVGPLSPAEPNGCIRYNSPAGTINLSTYTKPQTDAIQTNSILMASEYSINPNGRVTQSNYSVKQASGLLQTRTPMTDNFPSLGSNNTLGSFPENSALEKSLSKINKVSSDRTHDRSENANQRLQKDITTSLIENEFYSNSPSQTYNGNVREEQLRSNRTSESGTLSLISSNTRFALSLESDDELNMRPDTNNSRLMNASALNQNSLYLTTQKEKNILEQKSEYLSPMQKGISQSCEHPYLNNTSQTKGEAWSPEEGNIREGSTPSRPGSDTSLVSALNIADDVSTDQEMFGEKVIANNIGNSGQTFSASKRLNAHGEYLCNSQNALSIFPLEKLSIPSDETGSVLALPRQMTTLFNSTFNDISGNKHPHLSYEVQTADVISQSELNQKPEEVNVNSLDTLYNNSDDRHRKRKRNKKRAKAEKSRKEIYINEQSYPDHDTPGDGLLDKSMARNKNVPQKKNEERELFGGFKDQYVSTSTNYKNIGSSEMAYNIDRLVSRQGIMQSGTRSRKYSHESVHGTPMPDLKTHLPPRSVSSIPYNRNKSTKLDKSRLQPYMILRHEKQGETKQQQLQQLNQNNKQHKAPHLTQKKHANLSTKEKELMQLYAHQCKPQQQTLDQHTAVSVSIDHNSTEQRLLRHRRLSHDNQKLRSVSVPCGAKMGSKEDIPAQQLPATAPPLLHGKNEKGYRDEDREDSERDVQHWVNSTH